jgi:hypothetical protein
VDARSTRVSVAKIIHMAFEREILLKLKRRYRKDEAVAFISNELQKAQVEIGILKSEKSELEQHLTEAYSIINKQRESIKRLSIKANDPHLQRQLSIALKRLVEWRNLALSLKAKYEK